MSLEIVLPTPHPGQQKVLDCPTRHRAVMSARRWGKSNAIMLYLIPRMLQGKKTALFTPAYRYSLEHWRAITNKVRPVVDALGGRISEQEKRIEFAEALGGGTFDLWTLADNKDAGRGRDYDDVAVDEAGLVPDLQYVWESAIEPTLMDRKGRALLVGTPKGANSDFNRLVLVAEGGGDDEWAAFRGHTVDNHYIKDVVALVARTRKRAEARGTLDLWRQEYEGIPADDGTNAIGIAAIRAALTERSDRETVAWGVDLAKSNDWTVAIGLDIYGRWTHVERWQSDWRATKARLFQLCGRTTPVVVDSTGAGNPIVEDLLFAGMNVHGFVFSRKSRGLLIEELRTAIHAKRIGVPAGQVQSELESLTTEHNAETGFTRYVVTGSATDDCVMALALAWRCFAYSAPLPEWTPADRVAEGKDPLDFATDLEEAASDAFDDDFANLGGGW